MDSRTSGSQIYQNIMAKLFGNQTTRDMENYLRAQNSIDNMQIVLHPENYANPPKQIMINNDWTETVIRENKKVLLRK